MIKLKDLLFEVKDQLFAPRGKFDVSKLPKGRLRIKNDTGRNKPEGAFWTSSWTGRGSGWADWTKTDMPDWSSNKGVVFNVKGAKVLTIDDDKDYEKTYDKFPIETRNPNEKYLDWAKISKKYDGVNIGGRALWNTNLKWWDVESSAWFNMSKLKLKGSVTVR